MSLANHPQYWTLGHCPAWSFGKIPKGKKVLVDEYGSPGPAAYKPSHKLTHRSIPGFKMNGNARTQYTKQDNDNNPGTGTYQIPNKFGNEGPKYTMRGPLGSGLPTANDCSPGPSAYFPKLKPTGPAYSLGSRITKDPENIKNPGVGNYNLTSDNAFKAPSTKFGTEPKGSLSNMANPSNFKKWNEDPDPSTYTPNYKSVKPRTIGYSFGSESRIPADKAANRAPGPGNYNFNPKFGNEGTSPTMAGNPSCRPINLRDDEITPGPGAYKSTMYHKPNAPGFKMTGRDFPNMATNKNNPGPGSYANDTSLNKLLQNGPKWGMGDGNSTRAGNPNNFDNLFFTGIFFNPYSESSETLSVKDC